MTEEIKTTVELSDEEIIGLAIENVRELLAEGEAKEEKTEEKKVRPKVATGDAWSALFTNAGERCKIMGNASGGYFARIGRAFAAKD